MSNVTVGSKYFYKLRAGRGRPYVGEVVRRAGVFVEMRNLNSGELVRVANSKVGRPYEFKAYNKNRK